MAKKTTLLCLLIGFAASFCVAQTDISLLNVQLNRYSLPSVDNTIKLTVKNNGTSTVKSVKANWNDGNTNHIATITTAIAAGETVTINHPVPVNFDDIVEKTINVSVTTATNFAKNTSKTVSFNTLTRAATKRVLVEEGTGTWCSACPAGYVATDYMYKNYPNTFIGIAIQRSGNGKPNPMEDSLYRASHTFKKGLPGFNVDRIIKDQLILEKIDRMEKPYKERIAVAAPADLDIKSNLSGNELTVKVNTNFYTNFARANYKVGVILTESNITGPSPEYDQYNGYAGSKEPMGGYEKLPKIIPGPQMTYDHVGRELLGGYNGQSGSVPFTITEGTTASYTFNYSIPAEYNKDELHLVAVLINERDGSIENAKEVTLKGSLSVTKLSTLLPAIKMYPNPTSDMLNISFTSKNNNNYAVTVTTITGEVVLTKNYTNRSEGLQNIHLPLSQLNTGTYLVSVSSGKASYSKRIIVK